MCYAQLCLTLCNPMDCSPPGFSVHGIIPTRILDWVAISYSRGIFLTQELNPGLLLSPPIAAGFIASVPERESLENLNEHNKLAIKVEFTWFLSVHSPHFFLMSHLSKLRIKAKVGKNSNEWSPLSHFMTFIVSSSFFEFIFISLLAIEFFYLYGYNTKFILWFGTVQ